MQEPVDSAVDGGLTIIDTLTDDYAMDEELELREEHARLRELVQELDGRERQVILLRYGLAGQEPMTQNQVAALLGISRSYVSRIEKKAVGMLRKKLCGGKEETV